MKWIKSSWVNEFKKFALRGNLVDLAVGFTVGAAFTTIAKSLVSDIVMPPVGLLLGRNDFSDLYLLLKAGDASPPPYVGLAEAQEAGAVTVNYGVFLNNVLAFLLVALVMFLVIRAMNRVERQLEKDSGTGESGPEEPDNKKCPYCLSTVPFKASRCPRCTSQLGQPPAEAPPVTATTT